MNVPDRGLGRTGVAVLLLGLVVVCIVGAAAYNSSSTFSRDVPRAGVTQDIELRLSLSHLWLEESLGGDHGVDVRTDVYGNLDRASGLCRAMMEGGTTRFGRIEPMSGSGQPRLTQLCQGIEEFRSLAASRLANVASSQPGSSDDEAYDAAFERLLDLADTELSAMEAQISHDRDQLNRVGVGTVGLLAGLLGAMTVLARRKHKALEARAAEEALRKDREAHLATIVEGSSDAIMSATLDGEILTWNAGAQEMLGYTAEEMVGQSIRRIVAPEDAASQAELAEQVREGHSAKSVEGTRRRKDGSSVAVAVTVSPIRRNGAIVAMSGILRDVSGARELEKRWSDGPSMTG